MVRRRKSSRAGAKQSSKPKYDPKDARIKRWDTEADIPKNDIDLFHAERDKILLNGADTGRPSYLEDYDNEFEVFGMKEFEGDNDDEEEEEYYDTGDEDNEGDEVEGEEDYASSSGAGPSKSKSGKPNASKRHPSKGEPEEESNSGEERWGKKSEYYVSAAADDIDSDDEEALALELSESRRLQKKAREGISEDDFGIEEVLDAIERGQDGSAEAHAQDTQDIVTLIPQNRESLLRHLEKTSPEALALGREWEDVSQNLRKVEAAIARQTSEDENDPRLALVYLHHQSLLSYASVLAYYFYVRSTPVSGPASDASTYAKDVPQKVIDRLWQLKNALSILEDLGFSAIDDDDDDDILGSQVSEDEAQLGAKLRLSEQEIQALIAEMEKNKSTIDARNDAHKQRLRRARERQAASSIPDGVKNKSKVVAKSPPPKPKIAYDLEESEFIPSEPSKPSGPSNPPPSSPPIEDLSAFGEATSLDPHIAKEKAARKNALQFYTAKIERGQRRREGKRRHALTGDDDVPYQNTKERQSSKKPAIGGMELGGDDPHPGAPSDASGVDTLNSKKRGRDSTDGGAVSADVDGDEHHELVKRQKRESKENKRAEVEARAEPQRSVPDEQGPDTKPRSATTAILKNYGLTPKRSNADRNPRLRKRHQYEKAKKRVAHKKTTYKGGLASLPGGRYDGEKTGITKTVKSIKFT